jgi:hypothetical protein
MERHDNIGGAQVIHTVGELIEALKSFPADAQVRSAQMNNFEGVELFHLDDPVWANTYVDEAGDDDMERELREELFAELSPADRDFLVVFP